MTDDASSLAALARNTRDIYERNATRFDAERTRLLYERPWLDRFLGFLPPEGRILDLGCGTGDPIASYFLTRSFRVTGMDFSTAMIAIARERFPRGDWRIGDMRLLGLGELFDGVIGWDSFFHLTPEEQRSTLPLLAGHLKTGGALMLTTGPAAGEVSGHVGDDAVYHSSLAPSEYGTILRGLGLEIVEFVREDPECDLHTVMLARMTSGRTEAGGRR